MFATYYSWTGQVRQCHCDRYVTHSVTGRPLNELVTHEVCVYNDLDLSLCMCVNQLFTLARTKMHDYSSGDW